MHGRSLQEKPLVSIVLPVYNGEKYLRESLDSILAQTMQAWELIAVDDCSQDATPRRSLPNTLRTTAAFASCATRRTNVCRAL